MDEFPCDYRIVKSFEDMGLSKHVLNALHEKDFTNPSVFQQSSMASLLEGYDIIAEFESGSGKTMSYVISILNVLNYSIHAPQVVIMVPTDEIGISVRKLFHQFGERMLIQSSMIQSECLTKQISTHIVIGTPKYIIQAKQSGFLATENISMLVIDGFRDFTSDTFKPYFSDIVSLKESIPNIQTCIFFEENSIINRDYCDQITSHKRVVITPDKLRLHLSQHAYIYVEREKWKMDTIQDFCDEVTGRMVIFCNTKREVHYISKVLASRGKQISIPSVELNNDKECIDEFNTNHSAILITNEIPKYQLEYLDIIILYQCPQQYELYVEQLSCAKVSTSYKFPLVILFIAKNQMEQKKYIEEKLKLSLYELPLSQIEDIHLFAAYNQRMLHSSIRLRKYL